MKKSLAKSLDNDCFLKAFDRNSQDKIPVWLMRQAGRFLPEYQALKQERSMQDLFYKKEWIKKITLMPINRFAVDAAIIFSDILMPLELVGAKILFEHHQAPQVIFSEPFVEKKLSHQPTFNFLYEAIDELTRELKVPLIGFCGGPLTLLTYLFKEKKEAGEFYELRRWHYENPIEFQRVIDVLTEIVIDHLILQIQAGATACQIFDSWAGRFPHDMFYQYAVLPMKKIASKIQAYKVPLIYFSRNLGAHFSSLEEIPADAISVDGSIRLKDAFGLNKVIQGNLDPTVLLTNPTVIENEVMKIAKNVDSKRWIANLGHGVLPKTPIENVEKFIELIHSLPSGGWGH